MTKWTEEETLETILAREIQKAMNEEMVKWIKDPEYKPALSPMTFESLEAKAAWVENWNKVINRDIDD